MDTYFLGLVEMIERLYAMADAAVLGAPDFLWRPLTMLGAVGAPAVMVHAGAPGAGTQPSGAETVGQSLITIVIGGPSAAQPKGAAPVTAPTVPPAVDAAIAGHWQAPWHEWLTFYNYEVAIRAITTLAVLILSWWVLHRIFHRVLEKYKLRGATALGSISAILYFTLLAAHPILMTNADDIIAVTIHKLFLAILMVVAIRYVDRLVVLPLLTRISGGPPSRFIHQIILSVLSIFAAAAYCSWAFGVEVGSLVAGSAVLSIVIGLALQETLGNFFSGMVLQASVPFQPGDWIQIGSVEGKVVEMTWRAVTLVTGANNYVLIPNSSVAKEQIVNYHCPTVATATNVSVGLDYALPPHEAKKVLIQAAMDTPGVLVDPKPGASLASFDDSAILYKVNFWINEPKNHGGIEEAVRVNIWYRLNQAGYGIPFPVRTVEYASLDKKTAAAKQSAQASRTDIIKRSPLFSEMSPPLQEKLAGETRGYDMAAGQVFYRQGDAGDSLFILETGSVEITWHAEGDAKEIHVADFEGPAVFGEVSAMTGQPRAATYKAKTNARVIEVGRHHLQGLFTEDPRLAEHFSQLVTQRQQQRDEMMKKIGAPHSGPSAQSHEQTVLDRMKSLFTLRHR
jgi:small-conductance mechanosensitive channel/CRP-like cAMP-binding protein